MISTNTIKSTIINDPKSLLSYPQKIKYCVGPKNVHIICHKCSQALLARLQVFPGLIAIYEGKDDVAELLINDGADLNIVDIKGFTPLDLAAQQGNYKMNNYKLNNCWTMGPG